jgi:hypothetical protein
MELRFSPSPNKVEGFRLVGVSRSPFQRGLVFCAVVADDIEGDGDVKGDEGDDCLGLLASFVSEFLESLDNLCADAASATAKGDGDAGGDIV